MQLDASRYRHFVDGFDMPEEQKTAILRHVWAVMGSFVDRAFGTAPEQQLGVQISLGIARNEFPDQPKIRLDLVKPITPIFNDAARKPEPGKRRR